MKSAVVDNAKPTVKFSDSPALTKAPFRVALVLPTFVAGEVVTSPNTITTCSSSVVKFALTHSDVCSSHIDLTSTVYAVFGVRPVIVLVVVVRVSAAPPFNLNSYVDAVPFHVISAVVSVILFAERAVGASHGSGVTISSRVANVVETHSDVCTPHTALTSTI